ncbi:MAG: hypothetical protein FWF81_11735 [Defluviitaleaceae bacterium]|nr:hypothetical protein [Defluviitaleaceae bacterium]
MQVTSQQAERILKGNQSFSQLGFSMLITRLKRTYTQNPSNSTLLNCTAEINNFLNKFTSIMSADYALATKM